jgi:hypothetical protein
MISPVKEINQLVDQNPSIHDKNSENVAGLWHVIFSLSINSRSIRYVYVNAICPNYKRESEDQQLLHHFNVLRSMQFYLKIDINIF